MKNFWEICELHDDVKYGRLDLSRFAVELHSVLDGSADLIYTDPERFLNHTYPTSNMKYLLKEALRRISGKGGQPVFILDTELGGGKTHTLLLLYHVFKNPDIGTKYIHNLGLHKDTEVLEVPSCNVIAIDCRKLKKNTLWGEIAFALGKFEEFKEEDLSKQPIFDISKLKSLFSKPTLLLIDELPDYLLNAKAVKIGDANLSDLTISFISKLISVITATKDSMLIITLTGKYKLYEEYVEKLKKELREELKIEEINEKIKGVFSRQAQYIVPLEKEEISQVIKKRFIKKVVDEKALKSIVENYYNYFNEKGIITDIKYKQRLEDSYPLHPLLIDILYDRVSTIESFNKTRGILRLLALVFHKIYSEKINCPLVTPGDIPLDHPEIKDELTSKLERSYFRPIIETDCITKARKLDEKRNIKLAEKIAATIYLYSLIGAPKISGILPNEIKLAVGSPGIDPALIDEILNEIDREFWYLKSEYGAYYFDKEPNINKIIHDYTAEVSDVEIKDAIKEKLEKLLPSIDKVKVIIWDKSQLKDDDNLKIFVVDYDEILKKDERTILNELLEQRESGGIRIYRNTIVFILPEKSGLNGIVEKAKLLCAIKKAEKDERIKTDKERLKKLENRLSEIDRNLKSDCVNVYLRIAYPRIGDGVLKIDTLSFEQLGKENITNLIIEFLKNRGKLVEKLSPDLIKDIVKNKEKTKVEEVYNLLKQDKSQPFILSGETLLEAVESGILKGYFGYASELEEKEGKYVAETGKYISSLVWNGWLIRDDLIYKREIYEEERKEKKEEIEKSPLFQYPLELHSLKETIDAINYILAISPGREFEVHLYQEINDTKNTTKITIECKNWSKIKDLKYLIENFSKLQDYVGYGKLFIYTKDEEMIKDLEKYKR